MAAVCTDMNNDDSNVSDINNSISSIVSDINNDNE